MADSKESAAIGSTPTAYESAIPPETAPAPASEPPMLAMWASLVSGAGLAWVMPERGTLEGNQICTWKNGIKSVTLYLAEYEVDIVGLWKWLYS